jgi:putative zinc ribbon protein
MSIRELTDIHLHCASCGDGFVFTAGEQELFQLRGIKLQPRQCPTCLRIRGTTAVALPTDS